MPISSVSNKFIFYFDFKFQFQFRNWILFSAAGTRCRGRKTGGKSLDSLPVTKFWAPDRSVHNVADCTFWRENQIGVWMNEAGSSWKMMKTRGTAIWIQFLEESSNTEQSLTRFFVNLKIFLRSLESTSTKENIDEYSKKTCD